MKIIEKLSKILMLPVGYRLFRSLVGGDFATRTYLAEHVKPVPGEKVLDIGCGPADILSFLPAVKYTGLDISQEYIDAARQRYGSKARFVCGDVGLATIEDEQGTFDLVMAIGVVHHLDDPQAVKLFKLASRVLRPTGRLVTIDGCFMPNQSRIARWMLAHDRGKFVRSQVEYDRLASVCFPQVEPRLRQDLLRIPYTQLILCCTH